ncbi:DUF2508 family protein [uncultured Clostridium sp.]|jgi:hypothetical protein|uniref:DUF2508 family protein n=1 Tax=uncultured Clostridium sp. TaxID=59620 RepID=UPI0026084A22|nr:DUF2508 family protein [uncultured Clostridium sp.]
MQNTIIVEKNCVKKKEIASKGRNSISDRDFIINSVNETKGEIDRLRNNFDFISDPKLVESLIYKERDAMARYEYLLGQAKEKGIKVSMLYVYNNVCKKY